MPEFKANDFIIYQNGERFEIGKVKRLTDDGAFVWYHEGETAAKTPYDRMHKIENAYVIKITELGGAPLPEDVNKAICCMCPGAVCPGVKGTVHPEPSPCRLTSKEDRPLKNGVGVAASADKPQSTKILREPDGRLLCGECGITVYTPEDQYCHFCGMPLHEADAMQVDEKRGQL